MPLPAHVSLINVPCLARPGRYPARVVSEQGGCLENLQRWHKFSLVSSSPPSGACQDKTSSRNTVQAGVLPVPPPSWICCFCHCPHSCVCVEAFSLISALCETLPGCLWSYRGHHPSSTWSYSGLVDFSGQARVSRRLIELLSDVLQSGTASPVRQS